MKDEVNEEATSLWSVFSYNSWMVTCPNKSVLSEVPNVSFFRHQRSSWRRKDQKAQHHCGSGVQMLQVWIDDHFGPYESTELEH